MIYDRNRERILRCEKELNKILDLELKCLISNKKIFENLTHEKPTKRFFDIAHNIGKGEKISDIKTDNGEKFENSEKQREYITNFYSSLYSSDPTVGGTIEGFLGDEICNSPLVRNSKLTAEQQADLDQDLTFSEIEKALGESNMKSAPGIDGYSNKFIKIFFTFLGVHSLTVAGDALNPVR
jgi:hypothetical protein